MVKKSIIFLSIAMTLCISACGKKAETAQKTAEQLKTEQAAAAAKARESVVYGDQLKAMDKANEVAKAAAKATNDKVDELTK